MIPKPTSGRCRLYSTKKGRATGKARNLGTFATREATQEHECEIQYFKKR
jgi:hypothetical protein